MGDDYPTISAAARHRDWQGCDRLMFRQLYLLPFEGQRDVAAGALSNYMGIWSGKHRAGAIIGQWIAQRGKKNFPKLPDSERLDAADSEFESGLLQFASALSSKLHSQRTAHFASSVRSAVLAIQIDRWLHDFPKQYESWKHGEYFTGPTFLDDEAASRDAEKAWSQIDDLFKRMMPPKQENRLKFPETAVDIERAYADWENSLF